MADALHVPEGCVPAEVPPIPIVLHSAREPRPALKYQLLPPFLDRTPGNAAVHYRKALDEVYPQFSSCDFWTKLCKWIEMPLPELRSEAVKDDDTQIPLSSVGTVKCLEQGVRCETCDWDIPIREQGLYTPMPELQSHRTSARLLASRARLQIADGKFDEAVRTLQTGYAFARHVAHGPVIVQAMVGEVIARMMSKQVETLLQQPGAPNLYWALASLPRPMIDFRLAFEGEMLSVYFTFPELRDLHKKSLTPEQWRQLWGQTADKVRELRRSVDPRIAKQEAPTDKEQLETLATAIEGYPRAKRMLIAEGRAAHEVEAMPIHQVLLLYTMWRYEEIRDDLFKWIWLPFASAHKHMEDAERQFARTCHCDPEVIPIAGTLLPALMAAKGIEARADRDLAALQILEAIRLYGASHNGRLPEALTDITEVPIPLDPVRGEPFVYERRENIAILELPHSSQLHETFRYQIRLEREGDKLGR